ncbi:hypothetical protein Ndes2526B_g06779 [Nannochloris sp. 'desiccata']
MTVAAPNRAPWGTIIATHDRWANHLRRAGSRSRAVAVQAAPILAHKHASQLVVDNSHMEVETFGGVPKPPTPATLGGHDWPVEGSIQFGVAKTPINSAYNAEFCDPLLGQIDGKDILPNYLINTLQYNNTTELCAVALQQILAAATGKPAAGSPAKAAESLNFFLFVEKVVRISHQEFLGPQALSLIVKMMSYLSFSAATSNVLLRQHQSLAKKVSESFADCCAFEPFSINVDMIVDINETRARAPYALGLRAHQAGATYARRQLSLLQPMGEGSVSASQASRLLAAWSTLETRFDEFIPSNQQVGFLSNTFRVGIGSSSWAELEATAGAMEGFKFVPPSTTLPLLQSICEEAIRRFACGEGSALDTGAVLAVAQHTALSLPCNTSGQEIRDKVDSLLSERGISADAIK